VALYGATAGEACLLASEICANQACCGLLPKDMWGSYLFLFASLSTDNLKQQSRGSAQQNLSQHLVAEHPAILPSDSVVCEFDNLVKPLIEFWISNLESSQVLSNIRDTLLPKLLSGELRVPEAEKVISHAI
jgi:type I restriction enzyme S subunit